MPRRVFYSFHYRLDNWRVQQVKNMGKVEGQPLLSSNQWEKIKLGGGRAVEAYIDREMKGKSCVVVLIGSKTAGRKWVKYEIEKAWSEGKGLVGIYIHNLVDRFGQQDVQGLNPFDEYTLNGRHLSSIVRAYNPPQMVGKGVYAHIDANIVGWVEEAIRIRNRF